MLRHDQRPHNGHARPWARAVLALIALWCSWLSTSPLWAQGAAEPELPLPELPRPKPATKSEVTAEQRARLEQLLERITSPEPSERDAAIREILEVSVDWLPSIQQALGALARDADATAMRRWLERTREAARKAARQQAQSSPGSTEGNLDWLTLAHEHAEPKSQAWQQTIRALALSRMLANIGTVEAARSLVEIYVRFGEILRLDTQRQLEKLKEPATAALIEAERHPAEKVRVWARRQLDLRGAVIPSDAVQAATPEGLPDLLLAYGRTKNLDALRMIVAFASSERAQTRLAARQALALMGPSALWQLRDSYLEVVGKPPPRDWTWERTARELFLQFDKLQQLKVQELYHAALALKKQGDLNGMREKLDQVLTRNPTFDAPDAIAEAYLAYAEQPSLEENEAAQLALERALRLTTKPDIAARAQSLWLTLRAEALFESGVADRTLLARALEVQPDNERALRLLARFRGEELGVVDLRARYGLAAAIVLAALAAIFAILLRGRSTPAASPLDSP